MLRKISATLADVGQNLAHLVLHEPSWPNIGPPWAKSGAKVGSTLGSVRPRAQEAYSLQPDISDRPKLALRPFDLVPGIGAACDNDGGAPMGAGFGAPMWVDFTAAGMTATAGRGAGSHGNGCRSPHCAPH